MGEGENGIAAGGARKNWSAKEETVWGEHGGCHRGAVLAGDCVGQLQPTVRPALLRCLKAVKLHSGDQFGAMPLKRVALAGGVAEQDL